MRIAIAKRTKTQKTCGRLWKQEEKSHEVVFYVVSIRYFALRNECFFNSVGTWVWKYSKVCHDWGFKRFHFFTLFFLAVFGYFISLNDKKYSLDLNRNNALQKKKFNEE